jgi:hypothetical protein
LPPAEVFAFAASGKEKLERKMRFLEIYAGTAKLTHTVAEKGCEVADPIDLRFGTNALAH